MKYFLAPLIVWSTTLAPMNCPREQLKAIPSVRHLLALKLLQQVNLSDGKNIAYYDHDPEKVATDLALELPALKVHSISINSSSRMRFAQPKQEQSFWQKLWAEFFVYITELPAPPAAQASGMDLIFSVSTFLYEQNPKKKFDAIHEELRNGGQLIVRGFARMLDLNPLKITLLQLARSPKWAPILSQVQFRHEELSFTQIKNLLTPDKWQQVSVEVAPFKNRYASKKNFCQWAKAWLVQLPPCTGLDGAQIDSLTQDFATSYLQLPETTEEMSIVCSGVDVIIEAYKK